MPVLNLFTVLPNFSYRNLISSRKTINSFLPLKINCWSIKDLFLPASQRSCILIDEILFFEKRLSYSRISGDIKEWEMLEGWRIWKGRKERACWSQRTYPGLIFLFSFLLLLFRFDVLGHFQSMVKEQTPSISPSSLSTMCSDVILSESKVILKNHLI